MMQKAENFRRLAEKRTQAAIKAIHLLGNLSNKSNYEYTMPEVEKIISTLKSEVALLETRFRIKQMREKSKFTL